jgi:hypothetical protein
MKYGQYGRVIDTSYGGLIVTMSYDRKEFITFSRYGGDNFLLSCPLYVEIIQYDDIFNKNTGKMNVLLDSHIGIIYHNTSNNNITMIKFNSIGKDLAKNFIDKDCAINEVLRYINMLIKYSNETRASNEQAFNFLWNFYVDKP